MTKAETTAYYADLKHQAAILYIRDGLSAKEITERLKVSMPTVSTWRKAGRWDDLRPAESPLKEYKAAHLYIVEKLTIGDIAMKLSVSAKTIEYWVYKNGWDASRELQGVEDTVTAVVNNFCHHFNILLPKMAADVEFIRRDYFRTKFKINLPL